MLEAESEEEEIQDRLERNRELQRLIESELVRQRWQSEFEIAEELEREIRNQRWHEDLDREVEEMRRADEIESHFVRFVEPLVEPTRPQEEVVEEEFEGLAEEVILQFLQSEPPMHWRFQDREVDSDSDPETGEQFISGCGNNLSGRPMVDSGAFTSCCPEDYAREVPIEESPQLNLKSVLGEKIQH